MIITDNKRLSKSLNITLVDSFNKIQNSIDISAAVCTRKLAAYLLSQHLPNLKFIQLTSAGFDGVDIEEAKKQNIVICNAADVYNTGMAEFIVYAMLMKAKRYNHSINNTHIRPFRNYKYITELDGKTVGILGVGNIGYEVAKRLSSFNMRILGYALHTRRKPYFETIYGPDEVNKFLIQCDYIINCLPFTNQTDRLISGLWFDNMKHDVTFINVGRKQTINDTDFIHFLKKNKEAIAILDMFETFPNPFLNPYRRLSNVKILPGVTAISKEIDSKLKDLCVYNIAAINNCEQLRNRLWK